MTAHACRTLVAGMLLVLAPACSKGAAAGSDFAAPAGTGSVGEPLATSVGAAPSARDRSAVAADEAMANAEAPSLGTAYGEQRTSTVRTAPFTRASQSPDTVLALFYDDVAGLRRRASRASDFGRLESRVASHDGTLAVSLVDDRGGVFPAAQLGDRRFALASQGLAYRIGIENHSGERFEALASVDGLDVMNGSEAGFDQRGYIVDPLTSIVIEGWRTSQESVAAFRFSEIEDSYAERTGRARNIGVVGVAFFREEAAQPVRGAVDPRRADPFPGRFAPAPPAR